MTTFTFNAKTLPDAATSLRALATVHKNLNAESMKLAQDRAAQQGRAIDPVQAYSFKLQTTKADQLEAIAKEFEAIAPRVPAPKSYEIAEQLKLEAQKAAASGKSVATSDMLRLLADAKVAAGDLSAADGARSTEVAHLLAQAESHQSETVNMAIVDATRQGKQIDAAVLLRDTHVRQAFGDAFTRLLALIGTSSSTGGFDANGLAAVRSQVISASHL